VPVYGRCCGGPIGWRYPAVEAGMAALFALIVLRFGPRPQALVAALLVGPGCGHQDAACGDRRSNDRR